MTTEPKEKFFCKRCQKEITKEQHDDAIKARWLPLCSECEPEIKEKFKKWYPQFQKMNLR